MVFVSKEVYFFFLVLDTVATAAAAVTPVLAMAVAVSGRRFGSCFAEASAEVEAFRLLALEAKVTCNRGTLRGRKRDLTTGGTLRVSGRAGVLAQRAAVVNWVTKE